MAVRYRGGWRLAALTPLLFMVPLTIEAGLAYAAGVPGWPTLLIGISPIAGLYLLLLAVLKGWMGARGARRWR
jgi:hypothetical protein